MKPHVLGASAALVATEYGLEKFDTLEFGELPMMLGWLLKLVLAVGLAPLVDCGTRYGTVTVFALEDCLLALRK